MTQTPPPVSDTDLHAFVDGRLDEARRAEVTRYLAANPEQDRRARDWINHARASARASPR